MKDLNELNAEFYNTFPYPPPESIHSTPDDPYFVAKFIEQDVGRKVFFDSPTRIWVAGCGTNQALTIALAFPFAQVLGTDVSEKSIESCRRDAEVCRVKNLELRVEDVMGPYLSKEPFDYILCVGVIHHMDSPTAALRRLQARLKLSGVLEVMVYNQFHVAPYSAFQAGLRKLLQTEHSLDFEYEWDMAQRLLGLRGKNLLPDTVNHPHQSSFTFRHFKMMAEEAGLIVLQPRMNQQVPVSWDLQLSDGELAARLNALPDYKRWEIANLLAYDQSPLIWFYTQRSDGPPRIDTAELFARWVNAELEPAKTQLTQFIRGKDGLLTKSPSKVDFPVKPTFKIERTNVSRQFLSTQGFPFYYVR